MMISQRKYFHHQLQGFSHMTSILSILKHMSKITLNCMVVLLCGVYSISTLPAVHCWTDKTKGKCFTKKAKPSIAFFSVLTFQVTVHYYSKWLKCIWQCFPCVASLSTTIPVSMQVL